MLELGFFNTFSYSHTIVLFFPVKWQKAIAGHHFQFLTLHYMLQDLEIPWGYIKWAEPFPRTHFWLNALKPNYHLQFK